MPDFAVQLLVKVNQLRSSKRRAFRARTSLNASGVGRPRRQGSGFFDVVMEAKYRLPSPGGSPSKGPHPPEIAPASPRRSARVCTAAFVVCHGGVYLQQCCYVINMDAWTALADVLLPGLCRDCKGSVPLQV